MKKKLTLLSGSSYIVISGIIIQLTTKVFEQFSAIYYRFNTAQPSNFNYDIIAMICYFIGAEGFLLYWARYNRYDNMFKNLKLGFDDGIFPILKSKKTSKYSTTYKFTLPAGLSIQDIEKHKDAIEQHIGTKIDIKYINKGLFIIEEFKNKEIGKFDYEPIETSGNVPIIIGKDLKGKMVSFDLADGTEPHMLIAGNTGCGKTTIIFSIIVNLILHSNVVLHLIDLKHGASFSVFKKSSHVMTFADTLDKAEKTLKLINDEIEARYQKMARNGYSDVREYNKRHKNEKLPYWLLVIDEMVDFQMRKDLYSELEVISAKARGCGIHMLTSTQRPDKDILNGRIKCNITNVLGMKTLDAINSRIIIDTEGLEKLHGKGHGIFSRLGEMTEIQTPYITQEKAKELIKHTYIDKKEEAKAVPSEKLNIDVSDLEVFQ